MKLIGKSELITQFLDRDLRQAVQTLSGVLHFVVHQHPQRRMSEVINRQPGQCRPAHPHLPAQFRNVREIVQMTVHYIQKFPDLRLLFCFIKQIFIDQTLVVTEQYFPEKSLKYPVGNQKSAAGKVVDLVPEQITYFENGRIVPYYGDVLFRSDIFQNILHRQQICHLTGKTEGVIRFIRIKMILMGIPRLQNEQLSGIDSQFRFVQPAMVDPVRDYHLIFLMDMQTVILLFYRKHLLAIDHKYFTIQPFGGYCPEIIGELS